MSPRKKVTPSLTVGHGQRRRWRETLDLRLLQFTDEAEPVSPVGLSRTKWPDPAG